MMIKITETIPDDMPDWAIKAMADGKFFKVACEKVRTQDKEIHRFTMLVQGRNPDGTLIPSEPFRPNNDG